MSHTHIFYFVLIFIGIYWFYHIVLVSAIHQRVFAICLHVISFSGNFFFQLKHWVEFSVEKEMATHSSVLAWRMPWTEKPGRVQSMGSRRVGHDWSDLAAAEFSVLYSRLSLVIYFIHSINTVYMSILTSQFIPPLPLGIHTCDFWKKIKVDIILSQ